MQYALNAICPYFTMFPLEFPLHILKRYAKKGDTVLDPFAGRGTSLYAGRLRGLHAYGIDSNSVAVAISEAKLTNTTPERIVTSALRILDSIRTPANVPAGLFWELAYHKDVLLDLCRLREGLISECRSHSRKALRALLLGALHGPLTKNGSSHFSNQCPRTFSPKPAYAIKFWKEHKFIAPRIDVLEIIKIRAERFFGKEQTIASGQTIYGDSRAKASFRIPNKVSWIITSPPYYGMRTYIPDQWLRGWFVGGPSEVDYSNDKQLSHSSQDDFCEGLQKVWKNCGEVATAGCRLVIRFGAINDRRIDALSLIKDSLNHTKWKLRACRSAGSASRGKRQADHFVLAESPISESDIWAEMT